MTCREPLAKQASAYHQALRHTATFAVENQRLSLHNASGDTLALFAADNPTLAGSGRELMAYPKIRFDLEHISPEGLIGPPDGLRALDYEYCIPDHAEAIRQVEAIDPTLQIQRGSPGRVGCGQNQLLCLGHTHQTDFLSVLERLSALPFVMAIHQAFFE
jgi:hypothetical protein